MSITCMPSCLSTKMFAWLFCCTISLGAYRKMFLLLLWVAERPLINWEDFEYPWLDPNSQQSYASLSLSLSLSNLLKLGDCSLTRYLSAIIQTTIQQIVKTQSIMSCSATVTKNAITSSLASLSFSFVLHHSWTNPLKSLCFS